VSAGAWAQRSGGPADPQQLNRYSYVLNNPVRGTDPSGHCFGVLGGIDTLLCVGVVVLVAGSIAAVASSPTSGFNWNDYNWSDGHCRDTWRRHKVRQRMMLRQLNIH